MGPLKTTLLNIFSGAFQTVCGESHKDRCNECDDGICVDDLCYFYSKFLSQISE